jgi:hypothetical protein
MVVISTNDLASIPPHDIAVCEHTWIVINIYFHDEISLLFFLKMLASGERHIVVLASYLKTLIQIDSSQEKFF